MHPFIDKSRLIYKPKLALLLFLLLPIGFLSLSLQAQAQTAAPATASGATNCPAWLDHSFRQLHSSNTIALCDLYNEKPLVIVNTASYCGFTYQFGELEKLHQRYRAQGVNVIGFASNDFKQEAKDEAKTASICYENYGVTFTMMAPISVVGSQAHPLFKSLAEKSRAPSWNFNKFLVSSDGKNVSHFGSRISPTSETLTNQIQSFLASSQ